MLKTIEKSVSIHADPEAVWKVLTDNTFAGQWTSQFMPGSTVEGDWREGGSVYFKDEKCTGIRCRITAFEAPHHLRMDTECEINNDVVEEGKETEFEGTYDEYTLDGHGDHTHLVLHTECPANYYEVFQEMWDGCLAAIKKLAEEV